MYTLIDTFNNKTLSHHNSVRAAELAQEKHLKAVRKANGQTSYLTYEIRHADGAPLADGECVESE